MNSNHEKYMKRCYELAVNAGKKGYDTFGPFKLVGGIAKNHPDEKDLEIGCTM